MGQLADNDERRPAANRESVMAEAVAFLPPGSPAGRVPVAWRGFTASWPTPVCSESWRARLLREG
jgi:hypothetical protein